MDVLVPEPPTQLFAIAAGAKISASDASLLLANISCVTKIKKNEPTAE